MCSVKKCIYPRKYERPPNGRPTLVVHGSVGEQRLPSFLDRHTQTRVSSAIQKSPQAVKESLHDQRIQRHKQRQCIIQFYSGVANQKRNRKGGKTRQLGILQPSFPGNCERPVIDLSSFNQFLSVPKFKMETPESIRSSLRKGEWVTSIDLTDAYLHVPIHPQSRKFLRFHYQEISYTFQAYLSG